MRVLITGIEGFAGSHLAELLTSEDFEVHGIKHPESSDQFIKHLNLGKNVIPLDINEHQQVQNCLSKTQPHAIVHLAAIARVGFAWRSKAQTYQTNILATANLLENAASLKTTPKVLIVSSAEVYGPLKDKKMPIREDYPINPVNPYAVSKAATELIAKQFMLERPDLNWTIVRPFNHTGPRQGEGFVCSDFARQVALIEAGKTEPVMRVGNLAAKRDFTDVRDIVRAYKMLLDTEEQGIYQIASGKSHSISSVLDKLRSMSKCSIEVIVDEKKMRPIDTPVIIGDNTKIRSELGWEPIIDFDKTLSDLLESWRDRVKK